MSGVYVQGCVERNHFILYREFSKLGDLLCGRGNQKNAPTSGAQIPWETVYRTEAQETQKHQKRALDIHDTHSSKNIGGDPVTAKAEHESHVERRLPLPETLQAKTVAPQQQ